MRDSSVNSPDCAFTILHWGQYTSAVIIPSQDADMFKCHRICAINIVLSM